MAKLLARELCKSTPEGWLSMPSRLQSCWLCHFYHADGHPNAFCKFCSFHDSHMWSNRPHVACKIYKWWIEIQLISGAQDKDRWIDLDLDPGADWGPFSPAAMWWKSVKYCIEMTCQGMPHRNSDSGLSSSNTFANYVFGFFSLANCSILIYFASCQIRLIRRSGEFVWTGILQALADKQVYLIDQGSVTEEHELCRRNCRLLCQNIAAKHGKFQLPRRTPKGRARRAFFASSSAVGILRFVRTQQTEKDNERVFNH